MKSSAYRTKYSFHLILTVLICIVSTYNAVVQADGIKGLQLPLKSEGDLLFYSDIYQFETMRDKIRMEVCYSLDLTQFFIESQPQDEQYFTLRLKLVDKTGKSVVNISDKKKIDVHDFQAGKNASFIDLIKLDVQPDTLKFQLLLSDSISGKSGIINKALVISPVTNDLSCSDPVFIAYLRKSSDEHNIFTRHNLEMIPNPARFFELPSENDFIYVYFEINNLMFNPEKPSLYSVLCSVENLAGKTMSKIEHDGLNKMASNTSRIEKVSLNNLVTGMYSLNLQITDLTNENRSSIRRYFRVESDVAGSQLVIPMEDEDVDKYYDQIKYIARKQELDVFEQLDKAGKQEFLLYFWKSKDPSPDTPENEFMINHFRKIEYCEKNFRNGINSDRGRVYIMYGAPVDIERSTSTAAYSKPVEIWTYSLEGRIEFVFVDRTNDDHYVLMHSTHPDEYYNPDWLKDFQVYR
jgi:GWxTD domain-containing protein